MKHLKKLLCLILIIAVITTSVVFSAGATGTIAYGAGTVSASVLNIRSGPGTDYSIVSTVRNGSIVVILEQSTEDWYRINYDGTVGYVSADYLVDVLTAENFNATGKVNDSDVRYRTGPSTSDSIIGTIDEAEQVDIIGINNGWYKLVYDGNTGYMRSDYIDIISSDGTSSAPETEETEDTTSSETDVNRSGSVTGDYVRFRTGPSLTASIICLLNKGTSVDVLSEIDGWYKIVYSGSTGYMSSDYISLASVDSGSSDTEPEVEDMDEVGYVTGNYVRFRQGPSTGDVIITTLNRGTSVKILGKTDGWYKIEYNGNVGYMSADYIEVGEAPAVSDSYELGCQIAEYTKQFVGYSYVYGGASPSQGFDCSGLMYYVYNQFGYAIQRTAYYQYHYNGVYVSKAELQPGDMIFFAGDGYENGITHVGMYIGNGEFVHASTSTTGVIISDLNSSYYTRVYYGAKRIV